MNYTDLTPWTTTLRARCLFIYVGLGKRRRATNTTEVGNSQIDEELSQIRVISVGKGHTNAETVPLEKQPATIVAKGGTLRQYAMLGRKQQTRSSSTSLPRKGHGRRHRRHRREIHRNPKCHQSINQSPTQTLSLQQVGKFAKVQLNGIPLEFKDNSGGRCVGSSGHT